MSKNEFKEFVKDHPKLLNYVKNNEMSWQKFYEIYDIYGDNNEVWDEYLKDKKVEKDNDIGDFVNYFKNINLDNVQESINSIQRVLGVLGEISATKATDNTYEAKPIYKHFDD